MSDKSEVKKLRRKLLRLKVRVALGTYAKWFLEITLWTAMLGIGLFGLLTISQLLNLYGLKYAPTVIGGALIATVIEMLVKRKEREQKNNERFQRSGNKDT